MKKKKTTIIVDRDANRLTSKVVQVWRNGTYVYSTPLMDAQEMVNSGAYGISTEQAIFLIEKESMYFIYK